METLKTTETPVYEINAETAELHVTKGNTKVGKEIYTFSTLPGNEEHQIRLKDGRLLTTIPGTCGKHCENCFNGGCYAIKSIRQYHNTVTQAWGENTLLLRQGRLFTKIDEYITKKNKKYAKTGNPADAVIKIWRINVAGELTGTANIESWNALAKKHPEVTFGVYTKNYEALEEFMTKNPAGTEANFVINVSQWHGVANEFLRKHLGKFNVFEYDDTFKKDCGLEAKDKERLEATPHCIAVLKTGKHAKTADGKDITCSMCKKCYTKTGRITAVYAH